MKKANLIPITVMKLTVITPKYKLSRQVRKADRAAHFYAMHRNLMWWDKLGHLNPGGDRYLRMSDRYDKLYRRTLKVFQKYLP